MLQVALITEKWDWLRPGLAEDNVDRISYFITTTLLLGFAMVIGGNQYFGTPMHCMTPLEYPQNWHLFVRDLCFINGTYALPKDFELPPEVRDMDEPGKYINYYQWVPFFLTLQALLFYFPQAVWSYVQSTFGQLEMTPLVEEAAKCRGTMMAAEERKKNEKRIVDLIGSRLPGGCTTTMLFLGVKLLYVLNVVGQFVALNYFIGQPYKYWGFDVLKALLEGKEWANSDLFPRVTFCEYPMMVTGNVLMKHTECVLMLNMLNEKIFLFLWWWLIGVGIAATASFGWRLQQLVRPGDELYDLLPPNHRLDAAEKDLRTRFRRLLGCDGLLLFTFIREQAGAIVARNLLQHLLQAFEDEENGGEE